MVCCGGREVIMSYGLISCHSTCFLLHTQSLRDCSLPWSLSAESLELTPGAAAFTTPLKLCVKVSEFHVAKSTA